MSTKDTPGRGRPSEYKPEYVEVAKVLCEAGATDTELAKYFDVDVRTFYRWRLEHADFRQAIKTGKDANDERVIRSLHERATGYTYTEKQVHKVKISQFEETLEIIEVEKFVPPDPTAMIFWLKNRKPTEWREKTIQEVTGAGEQPLKFSIAIDRVNSVESAE